MTGLPAVARLAVELIVDADTLRDAEKALDSWMRSAEDDDRLMSYEVKESEWAPRQWYDPKLINAHYDA